MQVKCILCIKYDEEGSPIWKSRPVIGKVQVGQPLQSKQIMEIIKKHHQERHR